MMRSNASRQDWLTSFDVNVVGGVMLLKAARPIIAARGGGAVVKFGSISAKAAQTGRWLYPVSKAAILQLTRNEALDLAADKIRVNSVSPGWTWSNVISGLANGDRAKADAVAAPFHILGGSAIRMRSRKRSLFCFRMRPRSSPAPTSQWMAAIQR